MKTQQRENYRLIVLMNADENFLRKIFANLIQENIKTIIYHDRVGFTSVIQACSTYIY